MSPKSPRTPGPVGREVASIVRERMGRQRMTQADLVRASGVGQSTLSRILDDLRTFDIDELQSIAEALGTTASAIMDDAVNRVS